MWKNNSKLTMNVCPSDVRFSGSATDDKCIVIWLKITNSCHLSCFVMPANLGFVSPCDWVLLDLKQSWVRGCPCDYEVVYSYCMNTTGRMKAECPSFGYLSTPVCVVRWISLYFPYCNFCPFNCRWPVARSTHSNGSGLWCNGQAEGTVVAGL